MRGLGVQLSGGRSTCLAREGHTHIKKQEKKMPLNKMRKSVGGNSLAEMNRNVI